MKLILDRLKVSYPEGLTIASNQTLGLLFIEAGDKAGDKAGEGLGGPVAGLEDKERGRAGPWYTLELPWRENKLRVSCVPPGTYPVHHYVSKRLGDVLGVELVPGRSHIAVHAGNTAAETKGCILIGRRLVLKSLTADQLDRKKVMVTESKVAMQELIAVVRDVTQVKEGPIPWEYRDARGTAERKAETWSDIQKIQYLGESRCTGSTGINLVLVINEVRPEKVKFEDLQQLLSGKYR